MSSFCPQSCLFAVIATRLLFYDFLCNLKLQCAVSVRLLNSKDPAAAPCGRVCWTQPHQKDGSIQPQAWPLPSIELVYIRFRVALRSRCNAFPCQLGTLPGSIRFGLWTFVPAHLSTQRCLLLCVYHPLTKPRKRCLSCAKSNYDSSISRPSENDVLIKCIWKLAKSLRVIAPNDILQHVA